MAATRFFGPGFVHVQRATTFLLPVHSRNGLLRIAVIGHFHKREAAGLAGLSICRDGHTLNFTEFLKELSNSVFGNGKRQIAYKQLFHRILHKGPAAAS